MKNAFNKSDCIHPRVRVISLHNSTFPHNVSLKSARYVSYDVNWAPIMRHDSPLAAPVVTPAKEAAGGRTHVSVINCRKCCQNTMRVQEHYGRRVVVRKHTSSSVTAPINAFHRLCEDGIMTERAAVRSRTSVENRPFLCQPPMGQTYFYGGFDGGVGHQRVPQLHSCDSTADCTSPHNAMLWGMEAQL